MKKNGMLLVSLALNVALLAGLVLLGGKVEKLHAESMSRLNQIASDVDQTQAQVSAIRETQREQTELVEGHSFDVTGVDVETGTLSAQMKLTLRRWAEDTAVTLLADVDGESRTLPMTGTDGVFTAVVSLPLDGSGEAAFEAAVTSGGETRRESITSTPMEDLLPLRYAGGGWGGPEYQDGLLEVYTYSVTLERQYGAEVADPVLQVVKNGAVVQELTPEPAKLTYDDTRDIVDYELKDTLQVDCAEGDTVEIRLVCRDSFGLSYEFPLNEWDISVVLSGQVPESYTGYAVQIAGDAA